MMEITLLRANIDDAEKLHAMQVEAFKKLLEKYQDFDTSPANESVEKVEARLKQDFTFYLYRTAKSRSHPCYRQKGKRNKQKNFPDIYTAGISGERHRAESNPAV